ncbi:MAG: hypothetical protein FWD70_01915, partial [Desulfuromonadales bacterium]|nr:hypothetical protein [Desulfuromonadales bacterium]
KFADGTVWGFEDIVKIGFMGTVGSSTTGTQYDDIMYAGPGGTAMYGGAGNDIMYGGTGNDSLYGGDGDDILDGGLGNDYLDGGTGNNTYMFGKGDGQDTIASSSDTTPDKLNTIQFKEGIDPSEVTGMRSGNNLVLSIAGTTDKITVQNFYYNNDPNSYQNPVQQIKFADGTVWGFEDIVKIGFMGTSGSSTTGTQYDDIMYAGPGGTAMYGGAGNDIMYGGSGNDSLYGGDGDDILDGGAGNDYLDGGTGNNTYMFGKGDGQDTIASSSDTTPDKLNTIQFKEGIDPSEVTGIRSGNNLVLSIAGTTDKITIQNFYYNNDPNNIQNPVQQIKFADGTVWGLNQVSNAGFMGTSGNDTMTGTNYDDIMYGGAGNDTLNGGAGNDILYGGDGDDTLTGGDGDDILDGGPGNDTLNGGAGNDTYIFGRGYGSDTINDYDTTVGNQDILSFGPDITADQLWFKKSGSNLEVSIIGTTDKVTINNWYSGNAYHIEEFKTADGKTLLDTQVDSLVSAMASFSPPASGQTTLTADTQTALAPVIAANWK